MPRRPPIPSSMKAEVLFRNDHICCICRIKGKDVQIHHIDDNHNNNHIDNLAVLCLDCHSQVTGRRGLGQSYTPGEVRRYKRAWERKVQEARGVHQPNIRYQKELISQIDIIVCEILASEKNVSRANELLDVLYELNLWRGNRKLTGKIVEGLGHLALMTGLGAPRLAPLVAEKLWQLCWHFVGPDDVPMNKQDAGLVLDCVDCLRTLAEFNSMVGHGRKATTTVAEQLENFFEVGLWYSRKRIVNAVLRAYKEALKECYEDSGNIEFRFGRQTLRRSLKRSKQTLLEQQPNWRYQERRMDEMLQDSQ